MPAKLCIEKCGLMDSPRIGKIKLSTMKLLKLLAMQKTFMNLHQF
jgi:hypothetical protein